MKKLLLVAECLSGGVRRHITDLLRGLDANKYEITLLYGISRTDAVFLKEMERLRRQISFVPLKHLRRPLNPLQDFKAYMEIKRIIRRIKPDIVHCHSSKAGFAGRPAARHAKAGAIYYTPHAYIFQNPCLSPLKQKAYAAIEGFLSRHFTDLTFNVSEGERKHALAFKLDRPQKFRVILNGIPGEAESFGKEEARKELGIPANHLVVGCAARLDRQKDPHTFLKIAETIVGGKENVTFILIGDGEYYEQICRLVVNKGLEDRIRLPGFRSDADRLLAAFDVYLLTSLYEGLPYALIEALRAGLPIVATRTAGNTDIVSEGVNGYLFKPGNIAEGAEKVLSLLENSRKLSLMSQESLKLFNRHYRLESMTKELEAIYDNAGLGEVRELNEHHSGLFVGLPFGMPDHTFGEQDMEG